MIKVSNSKEKNSVFTYAEFVEYAKSAQPSAIAIEYNLNSSRNNDKDRMAWCGGLTFEESLETAVTGWDTGLEQLKLTDGLLTDNGWKFEPNVCGAFVNMGAYLQGQPDCMFDLRGENEFTLPQLTIYANLSYSAGNDGKKAMRFCQSITNIVNEKQSKFNVRIVGLIGSIQENGLQNLIEVVIKDYDQRFVLNNVAFAFHPSFFRRLYFAHLEAEEFIDYGYGQPMSTEMIKSKVEEIRDTNESFLTPMLDDLNDGNFNEDKLIKL